MSINVGCRQALVGHLQIFALLQKECSLLASLTLKIFEASKKEDANFLTKILQTDTGLAVGAWQMLPGANVFKATARQGCEWILVDCEHGNIDDAAMHEAVGAISSCGVSPIVRISGMEGWMIKRALDSGAHGVMVPLIHSVGEVEAVVRTAKFPTLGVRGNGSPFAHGAFISKGGTISAADYVRGANKSLLTFVQIETQEALDDVESIARVDRLDVLFVGPFDLGNSICAPIMNVVMDQRLKDSIARAQKATSDAGKATGIYCVSGEQARDFALQGFNMVSAMTDMVPLPSHMNRAFQAARGVIDSAGEKMPSGPYGS